MSEMRASEQEIPDYEFTSMEYIKQGFRLFQKAPGVLILALILMIIVQVLVSRLPGVGTLVSTLVSPVLIAGFYGMISKIRLTGASSLNDAIDAIRSSKVDQLMLLGIVQTIVTAIGFFLLVIPGIYLSVGYIFATQYVFFGRLPFWDAMERSRKVITKNWFDVFGFVVLILLLNLGGAICLGVGLLVTLPVSVCAAYLAFIHVSEQIEKPAPSQITAQET